MRFNTKDHEHIKIMEGILQVYHAKEVDKAWNMIRAWYTKGSSFKYQQKNTDEPTERLKKLFFTTKYLMQINQFSSLPKLFVEGFEKSPHYQLEEYLEYSELFKKKKYLINNNY